MKILVADKSQEIRNRIVDLLKNIYDNPQIFETESNLEAMAIVNNNTPDLVITDIDLYNGSGLSLLSLIRNHDTNPIRIVFTNHLKHDLEKISMKLGADYYLSKAHDFMKIKEILNNSLNYLS